jgi:hypothetical protein
MSRILSVCLCMRVASLLSRRPGLPAPYVLFAPLADLFSPLRLSPHGLSLVAACGPPSALSMCMRADVGHCVRMLYSVCAWFLCACVVAGGVLSGVQAVCCVLLAVGGPQCESCTHA